MVSVPIAIGRTMVATEAQCRGRALRLRSACPKRIYGRQFLFFRVQFHDLASNEAVLNCSVVVNRSKIQSESKSQLSGVLFHHIGPALQLVVFKTPVDLLFKPCKIRKICAIHKAKITVSLKIKTKAYGLIGQRIEKNT
jgi:hypothetical protein